MAVIPNDAAPGVERVAPAAAFPPSKAGAMTMKTKMIIAAVALVCVIVAIAVPSALLTGGGGGGGGGSISANQVPKLPEDAPEDIFTYRRFQSCSEMATSLSAEQMEGVTAGLGESFTFVQDTDQTSWYYEPSPSDYCEYCDCSDAPPRNEWGGGGGGGGPVIAMSAMEAAPSADAAASSSGAAESGGAAAKGGGRGRS